ncbi:MAG: peptide deformylase [Sulfobacillus thermosulfidooxidans]|nr:MAG: peptide deformylase [Sulfobacillus thermosulfidooxidans]
MQQGIWTIASRNDFLRQRTIKAKSVTQEVLTVSQDLMDTWDTMSAYGIAGPQIGARLRIFIWKSTKGQEPEIIINPKIIRARGEVKDYDGCLSVPGIYGPTRRAEYIELSGWTQTGQPFRRGFEGFDARIIQHEVDHLEGVLFIDRIDSLDELYVMEEIPSTKKNEEPTYEERPLNPELQEFIRSRRRPIPGHALLW